MTKQTMRFSYRAFEDYVGGGLLAIGLSLILLNVGLRYFFNSSKSVFDEFSAYFIVWGILIGFSVALRDDYHIKVDMLFIKIPLRIRRWVSVFANLVGLSFGLFYTYYGFLLVGNYYKSGQVSVDTSFPLWIVYIIMPISGLMFNFRWLEKIYFHFKNNANEWYMANGGGD